jgi:hypothetical protein
MAKAEKRALRARGFAQAAQASDELSRVRIMSISLAACDAERVTFELGMAF